MLIDACLFSGELDMLEFRLKILSPVVSHFIIVEADHTFSGIPKPFNLDANYERFRPYHDKIVYERFHVSPHLLPDPAIPPPAHYDPTHQCWRIEHAQRNHILKACETFPTNTLVLLGDVDEIPRREVLQFMVAHAHQKKVPVVMLHHLFCYNLRFLKNILWHGTIFTDLKTLREETPQGLRSRKDDILDGITDCGWHLSWFGGVEHIRNKIEAFSHQEYNLPEYKDADRIQNCINTGGKLLHDDNPIIFVAPQAFPDYFRESVTNQEWWG